MVSFANKTNSHNAKHFHFHCRTSHFYWNPETAYSVIASVMKKLFEIENGGIKNITNLKILILKYEEDKKNKNNFCYNYGICSCVPCNCVNTKFITKTHDFELDLEYNPSYYYLVLLRKDPIKNIEAYIRVKINEENKVNNAWFTKNIKLNIEDPTHFDILSKWTLRFCKYYKKLFSYFICIKNQN